MLREETNGALRVAKGVCDFCDEATLEEMREDGFSYFENSKINAFFKTCFFKNFLDKMILLRPRDHGVTGQN